MNEQTESRVRRLARRKGMDLVRTVRPIERTGGAFLYQLVVPGPEVRVFPQGMGAEGAPLHEVEDWLSYPWE